MRGGMLPKWGALVAAMLIVIALATPAQAQPSITGFSPTHGVVGSSVTVFGSGFSNASDVSFGNVSDPTYEIVDDTQINATVPSGASTGPISVTTPDGTASSDTDFTVDLPPAIDSLTPDHGPEHASVVITGSGLTGANDVSFGGTSATEFSVDSDTQITATVPTGADTGQIKVTTSVDTATSSGSFFVEPNIVMLLTDDQRWDTLWSMPTVESELVDKGVTFSNAFVVNSLCCPSRVSFLTGEYSHTSGVYSNQGPYGGFPSFHGDSSTIATWLHDRGYETGLIGKYLNQYGLSDPTYVPPGWDKWDAFIGENGAYYNYSLSENGSVASFGSAPNDYSTDVLANDADAFIRQASTEQPIFLWFTPYGPHAPATPAPRDTGTFSTLQPWRPPSFNETDVSDKPAYIQAISKLRAKAIAAVDAFRQHQYESLQSIDDGVAGIIQALSDTNRLDNTIIVFASDNGMMWAEHRWRGKLVPYEESIRVPMIVRWDRLSQVPRTDPHLVANIDVAPTLAELAGTAAPGADGSSLVPLLSGSAVSWRSRFLIESLHVTQDQPPTYCAIRTETQLFVHYDTGEEEFYNLSTDPYELKNKAGNPNNQAKITKLRDQTRALCNPLPPGMPPF